MAKVTSKLQVTLPRSLARQYGIDPGDEILWEAAGDVIRVVPGGKPVAPDPAERLTIFDGATARQRAREKTCPRPPAKSRGWTREELYGRGRAR
jgi:bifunctional DNA-binding transcriptional regulator/antitoxin component of YhaV-PrlF toxin-antitoxin module